MFSGVLGFSSAAPPRLIGNQNYVCMCGAALEREASAPERKPMSETPEKGETVTVHITADVVEAYDDGSALVDADGTELMVYEGEFW